jgi:hypothetical protein
MEKLDALPKTATSSRLTARQFHRLTCVLAGGLALAGGVLAVLLHPGYAALTLVGGLWLVMAPGPRNC